MRVKLLPFAFALAALGGCSSQPVDDALGSGGNNGSGGSNGSGGQNASPTPSACSAALRTSLSLVDEVSTGSVATLSETADERTLYVDASTGGLENQDTQPWVYIALATGQAVPVTDLQALGSKAWDLAFKRPVVRTNSGDSGPGQGGAVRLTLPWDQVDRTTLGKKAIPRESWFDDSCTLSVDASGYIVTTFSGWDSYNESTHVVSADLDVVFIAAAADGSLYKVAILDYFSTPSGGHGSVSGRYKLRIAPLP